MSVLSFLNKNILARILKIEGAENILHGIFQQRPQLEQLLKKYGNYSLSEYVSPSILKEIVTPDQERQKEFIFTFKGIAEQRLGEKIAEEVATQMQKYYFVSTGDHHGPASSIFGVHSNMVIGSGYNKVADPILKYIVVLSCANISLNNSDFPRGFMFHSLHGDTIETQKLSFLPSNSHSCLVYHFRPYLLSEVVKVQKSLQEKKRQGFISVEDAAKIERLLETIYLRPEVLESKNYDEQMTKSNLLLWREYFSPYDFKPELLYIEQEEVVVQLLLQHHLEQKTLIHQMIFAAGQNENFLDELQKVMAPFLRHGAHGTDLFWLITEKHYRQALHKENNELVSEDGRFHFKLAPEIIGKALREGILVPNLLLIFTVLCLYYQLNCFGGYNQMHYLTAMRDLYNQKALDTKISKVSSDLFSCGLQVLFLEKNEQSMPAFGLDLFLHGLELKGHDFEQQFDHINLYEAFLPELLEKDHEISSFLGYKIQNDKP